MSDTKQAPGDLEIEIAGRVYVFGRSLETLRCIEEAVGSAALFAQRLDRREATAAEIVKLYAALLRRVPKGPLVREIEAWVFEKGMRHAATAVWMFSLTLGSDELERVMKARATGTDAPPAEGEQRNPFAQTDASTGASSLDWRIALAGLRPNSEPQATLN